MKNKIVIAVIDSGVDRDDSNLKTREIEDYYFENQEFHCNFKGNINMHGTEVIKVILKEAPDVKIISIKTLHENNKCMLSDIISAMQFAIDKQVNIINLSLGSCISKSKRVIELEQLCIEATKRGIVVFAADNNPVNEKSYPANFDCVIGVTSTFPQEPYCRVDYKNKIVTFSESLVYIPDKSQSIVRNGNSYLCPLLVGLFCDFVSRRTIETGLVEDYMEFLLKMSREENLKKVFFNRYSDERFMFDNKRVLFFVDDMDLNNMQMFSMYKEVCDISLCFDKVMYSKQKEIDVLINDTDIFFIGALSPAFIYDKSYFLQELLKTITKKRIPIVTVYPIINTYQRICLTNNMNSEIKSIYK